MNRTSAYIRLFLLVLFLAVLTGCQSELEKTVADCREQFPAYAEQMNEIDDDWRFTFDLALATSRVNLSEPVGDLRDIRQQANAIVPPACIAVTHERYIEGMDTLLDIILDFMADPDAIAEPGIYGDADYKLLEMTAALQAYERDQDQFFVDLVVDILEQTPEANQ